jgi:hypothetical protein
MRRACLFALLLSTPLLAQQPSKIMTKMVVQLQGTDVPVESFAAKPKTMYRAGTQFCRVEEMPDPEHGIHGLMITNEPDAWMVNLETKSAQHMVDPGPSFNCRMPIFASFLLQIPQDEAKQFGALEFGYELDFFKTKGASPHPGGILQGKETMSYKLQFGESSVALFTYGTPERPLAAAWIRGEKHEIFWYSGYGELNFDPKLFAKPDHVTIEDAKH